MFAACAAAAHAGIPGEIRSSRGEQFVPRPEVARLTALGFDAVLSDYYWLQAVQIVGHEGYRGTQGRLLGRIIDVVTSLDPWVDHAYRFAAIWMTDTQESVHAANRLLERGIDFHPDEWRNRFYLGFNHFFYLNDNASAAEVLEGAVSLDGSPSYLKRLVARLKSQTGGLEAAAVFLSELVRTTGDEYARAELQKGLDEVETERRARLLDAARIAFWKKNGRDFESIEELATPPQGVIRGIPPEPHGWEWEVDEGSGGIVSTYYGHRYEPLFDAVNQQQRKLRSEQDTTGPPDAG